MKTIIEKKNKTEATDTLQQAFPGGKILNQPTNKLTS